MVIGYFFFNDTATTEIYTLSLHDALPIFRVLLPRRLHGRGRGRGAGHRGAPFRAPGQPVGGVHRLRRRADAGGRGLAHARSEEHTSELQSRQYLVCRLLLEKKNTVSGGTR